MAQLLVLDLWYFVPVTASKSNPARSTRPRKCDLKAACLLLPPETLASDAYISFYHTLLLSPFSFAMCRRKVQRLQSAVAFVSANSLWIVMSISIGSKLDYDTTPDLAPYTDSGTDWR